MATILVVDDDQPILDLLTEILEECGHATLRAANGQEALALAQRHHPEIIITDVMMPIMDGFELLKAIRNMPELACTCVILASAGISKLWTMSEGLLADGYISKPFSMSEVEHVVRSVASM